MAALSCLDPQAQSPVHRDGNPDTLSWLMPRMLLDLQNRGQLAAGMSTYNPIRETIIQTYKRVGTVAEAFKTSRVRKFRKILNKHTGRAAIGHTRYATCGGDKKCFAQPFERKHGSKRKWFAFSLNGNIANLKQLQDRLLDAAPDYHLTLKNDTEIIMHYLAHAMRGDEERDLVDVFAELSDTFDGSYNIAYLNADGELVVCRDPIGFRPMCYAVDAKVFAAASESVALTNLGFKDVFTLEPGELIHVKDGKVRVARFAKKRPSAHCFFEWAYFANVASTLDERSVYLTRSSLGRELAAREREANVFPIDSQDTIVVPVPDTGKAAADAMAFALGVPSVEGLIRNRYVGRTFIEAADRAAKVRQKFTPLKEVLKGKRVILVDDSIVRSTTLNELLKYIREKGEAKEIHVRVACPPIVAPCYYGIDMSEVRELYAPKFISGTEATPDELAKMARDLGADSLIYLPLEAVARSIGLPEQRLCRACLTGQYPTSEGQRRYQLELVPKTSPTTGSPLLAVGSGV
ncbi:MAG: amidophosphoribosyltransferase [Gemmataceae bacterium]